MKPIFKLLVLFFCISIQAHTVWIETNTSAKINQKHELKIFFGEIDEPTPTTKWFSDIKDLEVKIKAPSGKEMTIKDKTQQEKYYSAFFVPTENGIYTISVRHLVKDTHRRMKITYQAVAFVETDNKKNEIKLGTNPLEISINNNKHKLNTDMMIKLFLNGEENTKDKAKVISDNGWAKTLLNKEGQVTFRPLWKGKYLLEYTLSKKESGEHNGKSYDIDYEMITYFINL